MPKALILGGTYEARVLAEKLRRKNFMVISSLLGVTPGLRVAGEVRLGGFGGHRGLAGYLKRENIDMLIDATHPFAERISANAAVACDAILTPRLVLHRPPWRAIEAERVKNLKKAAPHLGKSNFLALGSRGWEEFAEIGDKKFVLRSFIKPDGIPPHWQWEQARRSYALTGEVSCMKKHGVDTLVCRNSGGDPAKLRAASRLNIKVVMVDRPAPPPPPTVGEVGKALEWALNMAVERRV